VGADLAMPSKNYDGKDAEKQRMEELLHLEGFAFVLRGIMSCLFWTFFLEKPLKIEEPKCKIDYAHRITENLYH
jgi:hypothetical protein